MTETQTPLQQNNAKQQEDVYTRLMAQLEIAEYVTRPVIKIPENGSPVVIKIDGPIHEAQQEESKRTRRTKQKDANGNDVLDAHGEPIYMDPPKSSKPIPYIMDVTDLLTNTKGTIVVNSTLQSNLERAYKDESYVGRVFQIKSLDKKRSAAGFEYRNFEIIEYKMKPQAANSEAAKETAKTPIAPVKK